MNSKLPIIAAIPLLALALFFQPTAKAQSFEGIIYYKVPEMEQQGIKEMPYMIKESKARLEFGNQDGQGAMLILPQEEKMVIVMKEMKAFMEVNIEQAGEEYNQQYSSSKATKTGSTKVIAGRECEVWAISSAESSYETCLTEGIGTFMMPSHPMYRKNSPEWAKEVMKKGLMPLEVVELRKDGKRVLQMIATQIESKPLDDKLFKIPEGYRNMSGMMQQMMNRQH